MDGRFNPMFKKPGVAFKKRCVTNQYFNENARRHAALNGVAIYHQDAIRDLLARIVVKIEVEKIRYAEWDRVAS